MKMFSTFDQKAIKDTLKKIQENQYEWTLWQTSTQGRHQHTAVIEEVAEDITKLTFLESNQDVINENEPIFGHCPKLDVIFKRERFNLEGKGLNFKTPTELKMKERRRIERYYYKYQDFKNVSFRVPINETEELKPMSFTLMDLSTAGLGFVAPYSEVLGLVAGAEVLITHITDQELPENHKSKIAYIERFLLPEGLKDRTNTAELMKVGIEFTESLESVTYKSISSIVQKRQQKMKGLDCEGFNGLQEEEQLRIIQKVGEENKVLASNLIDRIEELDRLRYMTNQMKQIFWVEVNKDKLAAALRLSSKELIFDLLNEVTENMRDEFLEKLDQARAPSAINKAQDEICNFIREKEKAGEFVLDPKAFTQYV